MATLDPHINPASGVWDDNYYAQSHQGNKYQSAIDAQYAPIAAQENAYVDQLLQANKGQLDLSLKQLDAAHKLALGNDDAQQAKFLESVANTLEQKVGRIPYDYQKYTNRELQDYTLKTKDVTQRKQQAFDKLNNDESLAKRDLGFDQSQKNQSTAEDLNSRGLLYGQTPTGLNPNNTGTEQDLGGLNGLAGKEAGIQNTGYANQFSTINSTNDLAKTALNQNFDLSQAQTDFAHQNSTADITDKGRRDAQDNANSFTFGNEQAQLEFKQRQDDLNRQRQKLLEQDKGIVSDNVARQQKIY